MTFLHKAEMGQWGHPSGSRDDKLDENSVRNLNLLALRNL
jgi:hypothetical protein